MQPTGRLNVEELPDSAYTRELRAGVRRLRFAPELEREFVTEHLQRARLRVKVWSTLSAAMSVLFLVVQGRRGGVANLVFWAHLCGVPCTLAFVWLSWSRLYLRFYLPVATVLAPLFGVLLALLVAPAVAAGHDYSIALLAVHVIAAMFFMGLLFRAGLVTALVMLLTFGFSTFALGGHPTAWPDVLVIGLATFLSAIVGLDIEASYRRTFLESALLSQWVTRDGLSGLMNRRTLDLELPRIWAQAQRDRRTVALMMIDIDHFKSFNDTHGHQCGDQAIRSVARLLQEAARRPLDLAARYGGEEFVVMLYDVPVEHAEDIAERLRRAVQGSALPTTEQSVSAAVTISLGMAVICPTIGRTAHGALQLADEALYEAKQAGRNRMVVKGSDEYRVLRTGLFARG